MNVLDDVAAMRGFAAAEHEELELELGDDGLRGDVVRQLAD